MGHPISPPNNIVPPTTLWHTPQTTHPLQVLQGSANNWDSREDTFINTRTETLTLIQTLLIHTVSSFLKLSAWPKEFQHHQLNSFYMASLSSGIMYLRVWGARSIIVFSPLHCTIHFAHPTDYLCHFRNHQGESCHAICWFLSAVNVREVGKGGFLSVKVLCHSEVWDCISILINWFCAALMFHGTKVE